MSESKDNTRLLLIAMVAVIGALVVAVLALVLVISNDDESPSADDIDRSSLEALGNSVIEVDEAEVGQCLDIASEDDTSVTITDQACDGDHDGEITWVGTFGDIENADFVPTDPDDLTDAGISFAVCTDLMEQADVDAIGDDVEYHLINEDAAESAGRPALCYATTAGGEPYTEKQLP